MLQYKATVSARHSSIDEDTSPRTDPGVWPGLYQDVLSYIVNRWQASVESHTYIFSPVRGLMTWKCERFIVLKIIPKIPSQCRNSSSHQHPLRRVFPNHVQEVRDLPLVPQTLGCPRHRRVPYPLDEWRSIPHLLYPVSDVIKNNLIRTGNFAAIIFWNVRRL